MAAAPAAAAAASQAPRPVTAVTTIVGRNDSGGAAFDEHAISGAAFPAGVTVRVCDDGRVELDAGGGVRVHSGLPGAFLRGQRSAPPAPAGSAGRRPGIGLPDN